jgi:hypothetical protein
VNGYPQVEPGVTEGVQGGWPHAQPVRAVVDAARTKVEGLRAFCGLRRWMVLE